ncbi:hypothetical protein Cs7R123_52470 [Catellatospora sp. TT07R-123]|uniref:neuraminidase-like domain-containing protein n=1 Tax=Catellatospora sp. TT07R-123 TaxID=2733863 RepID=UPI001AFDD86B|nr:neuraminidase-like domain-containing protein [Catellatospora sp. TT07R-123]GHJ47905.1 hypothetical protein Cs7R123_52470 [Catellatospora sp. TT07R-123]
MDHQPGSGPDDAVRARAHRIPEHEPTVVLGEEPTLMLPLQPGLVRTTTVPPVGEVRVPPVREGAQIPPKVPAQPAGRGEESGSFRVYGTVTTDEQRGLPGVRVVVYGVAVGRDTVLAEAATDRRGDYTAGFELPLRSGDAPDVLVRVLPAKGETVLGASEVRYNIAAELRVDVTVAAAALGRADEHARLTGVLRTHLDGLDLSELREDDERTDLTYLANKTGWDARLVAMASTAQRLSRSTEVPAPLYYALFRAGVPTTGSAVGRLSERQLTGVWEQAAKTGVIEPELARMIPDAVGRIRDLGARELLDDTSYPGPSTLAELLRVSGLEGEAQLRYARLLQEHQSSPKAFWKQTAELFGEDTAARLRVDSQLADLTVNNAALVARVRETVDPSSTADLVRAGLYRREGWAKVAGKELVVPEGIPGDGAAAKRANYLDLLADQVRLSHPTAVVADLVRREEIPVAAEARGGVQEFLAANAGAFEIGVHPVDGWLARTGTRVEEPVLHGLRTLQRVYQISPSDTAMAHLLRHDIDAAYTVTQYDEDEFVDAFAEGVGGPDAAKLVYAKAQQVRHAVLNVTTQYLSWQSSPALTVLPTSSEPDTAVTTFAAVAAAAPDPNAGDLIVHPTLEQLFGEMDFCSCDHCRSVLSPAAYLVDLLQFLDLRRYNAAGTELPKSYTKENPLDVLLSRRPDLAEIDLTCENTNTALPYIDLVNEVLEHYAVAGSLTGFAGFNIDADTTTPQLLAAPQHLNEAAYAPLKDAVFPVTMPFHRPLAALRRHLTAFGTPLHQAMASLRRSEALTPPGGSPAGAYGWRDILIERLGLTRKAYQVLTDGSLSLSDLYGSTATGAALIAELSNAKALSRRLGLTYQELIDLLRTDAVNPAARLLPYVEALHVGFGAIEALHGGTLTPAAFTALLPEGLDTASYGGDVPGWVQAHHGEIMSLLVLVDPDGGTDSCAFDELEVRHAPADMTANRMTELDLHRLHRFVRLQRALGWTIGQTDKAYAALYPAAQLPLPADTAAAALAKLDQGWVTLLERLAHVVALSAELPAVPKKELTKLLACVAPIGTRGADSLYRQLFLSPGILNLDPAFKPGPTGAVLTDATAKLADHAVGVTAAVGVTPGEYAAITAALGYAAATPLTLDTVSAVYRYAYLARKLKLSIAELVTLRDLSGIDPFGPLTAVDPPLPRFVALARQVAEAGVKLPRLAYFLRHEDPTGKSSPTPADVLAFARQLRADLGQIERDNAVGEDPVGEVAKSRFALVYGAPTADTFFGLLTGAAAVSVSYDNGGDLPAATAALAPALSYDDFAKTLTYRGLMTDAAHTALQAAPGMPAGFDPAVTALRDATRAGYAAFFARYPDLRPLYDTFADAADPLPDRFAALTASFLPTLRRELKLRLVRQTVATLAETTPVAARALIEDQVLLHGATGTGPAVDDLLGIEQPGTAAALPPGTHRWHLDPPASGFYHLLVQTAATVTLTVGGAPVAVTQTAGVWRNTQPVELTAGLLTEVAVTVASADPTARATVRWESPGLARDVIPGANLFPAAQLDRFSRTYLRLLKVFGLAEQLTLSPAELRHFALAGGVSWLPDIPVAAQPGPAGLTAAQALFTAVRRVLVFGRLRTALKVRDDSLAAVLADPGVTAADGTLLRGRVTRWDETALSAVLTHLGLTTASLSDVAAFARVQEVFATAAALRLPPQPLLAAITNEPTGQNVRDLQGALRAQYDDAAWYEVLRPVNDDLRDQQRDALVALILDRMRRSPLTAHIDTPDRLFEFFLLDVEMEPCMQTSRIRLALSAVQLFVQRCLLNLEDRVAVSSVKAKRWDWMKRYRVWEANRKVYLWPENWLDPVLRDDKSPFFKELESELLQSDLTEETAAESLHHYLEKLGEVARLEIVGMYVEEAESGTRADDVVHVIGRTAGTRRKYFYRRQANLAWSAWERINLDIEDAPVLPVIWRGRLLLFWTAVAQQQAAQPKLASAEGTTTLANLPISTLASAPATTPVGAQLYWSEYWGGKWQAPRTSNPEEPLSLGTHTVGTFDRAKLILSSWEKGGSLLVRVHYAGNWGGYFKLYQPRSMPVRSDEDPEPLTTTDYLMEFVLRQRDIQVVSGKLKASYWDPTQFYKGGGTDEHTVLDRSPLAGVVQPMQHGLAEPFQAPFFVQDRRHVFYVTPDESWVPIEQKPPHGRFERPDRVYEIPHLKLKPDLRYEVIPEFTLPRPPEPLEGPLKLKTDVLQEHTIRTGLLDKSTVMFNGRAVGAANSIGAVQAPGLR